MAENPDGDNHVNTQAGMCPTCPYIHLFGVSSENFQSKFGIKY